MEVIEHVGDKYIELEQKELKMKSSEEEIDQELEVLVDGRVDTALVSQAQEEKSFEEEEDNTTDSVKEEDQETKDEVSKQRLHAAKVGFFDVLLYLADVVSDGLACAKHYWNCHNVWAGATAAFMLLPAFAEASAIFFFLENGDYGSCQIQNSGSPCLL